MKTGDAMVILQFAISIYQIVFCVFSALTPDP